jgi:antitoxin CptB
MNTDSIELSKIRWRCRRGTKELDHLLLSYFENHYREANESEKACFEEILSFQDPVLIKMFADPQRIQDKNMQQIIIQIIGNEKGFLIT